MSLLKFTFLAFVLSSSSLAFQIVPTIPTSPTSNNSPSTSNLVAAVTAVGNASNVVSNLACEANPSHLLCGASVKVGHKIESYLPGVVNWRHCSILTFPVSPHCCRQFCKPASAGRCDTLTGACFCEPKGVPNVCGLLIGEDNLGPLGIMSAGDDQLLALCQLKCATNPNGCNKTAAATDGVVGTVCVCYCSDSTTGETITQPPIQLPSLN